ncbi:MULTISPECIES: hypothetical protein [unclassified Janthinobacterium]|uniref:hypothetical protein n=1 Tax=unclassified Janthinobacterium TaxID=2610881 RepID=UPI0016150CBF|nr:MULTISPECIES: hypothetical protein [unclassified Janthinobacterium]MBB5368726.1 hypothetical protein [Janthinobacterium sp. K2C7]MBB5381738.1 hypothetical protein [Janthinobacterium sp. K2Li3]MBB5387108.1 hypothetical protein [Janthinobacterium sp. K2E3]
MSSNLSTALPLATVSGTGGSLEKLISPTAPSISADKVMADGVGTPAADTSNIVALAVSSSARSMGAA